jgi:hypothetical protein
MVGVGGMNKKERDMRKGENLVVRLVEFFVFGVDFLAGCVKVGIEVIYNPIRSTRNIVPFITPALRVGDQGNLLGARCNKRLIAKAVGRFHFLRGIKS